MYPFYFVTQKTVNLNETYKGIVNNSKKDMGYFYVYPSALDSSLLIQQQQLGTLCTQAGVQFDSQPIVHYQTYHLKSTES